jgi:hypothetical protein
MNQVNQISSAHLTRAYVLANPFASRYLRCAQRSDTENNACFTHAACKTSAGH